MISKGFFKSSVIYTLAGSLPMASAILLMPFYAKFLNTELFGLLSIYFAIALLIQILVSFSFDASIYVNYHERISSPQILARFLSSMFIFILMLSLCSGILFSLIGSYVFVYFFSYQLPFFPFGILTISTGIFQAILKVNNSLLQVQEKSITFLATNLFSFALVTIFTLLGLKFFPNTLWGPIGGKLLGVFVCAVWVLGSVHRKLGLYFDWKLLKPTFGFNLTSLVYQIQQWFINYFDRPLLLLLISASAVGYFDLAVKCLLAIDLVLTGLNATIYPKVIGKISKQEAKQSNVEINRYYHGLTAISIIMVVFSILLFPFIIDFFFDKPSFKEAIFIIPFVSTCYLLKPLRFYFVMPYTAIKYSKPFPWFYLVIMFAKVLMMISFVPKLGVLGATMAMIISQLIELLILYFGIRNRFQFRFNKIKMIFIPSVLLLLIVACELIIDRSYSLISHILYVAIAALLLTWVYRNELSLILVKTFSKMRAN
ncbi:MAG: lipopolysaccharide biosynthesis protein [Flammeovirgaceae bacterium]